MSRNPETPETPDAMTSVMSHIDSLNVDDDTKAKLKRGVNIATSQSTSNAGIRYKDSDGNSLPFENLFDVSESFNMKLRKSSDKRYRAKVDNKRLFVISRLKDGAWILSIPVDFIKNPKAKVFEDTTIESGKLKVDATSEKAESVLKAYLTQISK